MLDLESSFHHHTTSVQAKRSMAGSNEIVAISTKCVRSHQPEEEDPWNDVPHVPSSGASSAVRNAIASNSRGKLVMLAYEPLESFLAGAPQYLGHMVYQMLNCLHDLHYAANISHHDVSLHSIMVRRDGPDGEPEFLLNDLDLATRVSKDGAPLKSTPSGHRTGTLPFMSWEILYDLGVIQDQLDQPAEELISSTHRLRYDYESLLYVTIRCCFMCEKTLVHKDVIQKQVGNWELGPYNDLSSRKHNMLMFPLARGLGSLNWFVFSPNFECWRSWLGKWVQAVSRAAFLAKSLEGRAADEDSEALYREVDDSWSHDAILKALRGHEPEKYRAVYA